MVKLETIFYNLHGNLLQKDKEVEIERKFSFGKKPGREDGDKNMETTIKKRFTSRKKRFTAGGEKKKKKERFHFLRSLLTS